jgi:vanillate O-demethylase monooxygenase subunit
MMDNFLDTAHFPFVHPATIGLPDDTGVEAAAIEHPDLGLVVHYEHDFDIRMDPGVERGDRRLRQRRRLEYLYAAPFAMKLRIDELDTGRTSLIVLFARPAGPEGCVLYVLVLHSGKASEAEMADALAYELVILGENLALQERFADVALPLGLTVECHTKADRVTVELRRVPAGFMKAAQPAASPALAGSAAWSSR